MARAPDPPVLWAAMRFRDSIPVVLALAVALALLLPMSMAFRADSPLASAVDQLQLEWLRTFISASDATPSRIASFADRVDRPELRELSRFSPVLADALDVLPSAINRVARLTAARWNDPETTAAVAEAVRDVDHLLATVRRAAEILDEQQNAAYRSLVLFALVAAVGFAVLWLYQARRVRLLVAEATDAERLAALERRVQDHERRRLARELHDGAAQELAIARMVLDRLDRSEPLDTLRAAVASAGDEIRLLYRAMDPRFTDPAELRSLLQELAVSMEHRSGQHFEVAIDSLTGVSWSPETQLHLFRVAQESMHNVVRHARAEWASLSLRVDPTAHVSLRVEDDGIGLNGSPEHYGRRGIRERVELMHGTVQWRSRDPRGTVVEAVIPIHLYEGRDP